ncbi:Cupin-like domain-containing protein [Sphingopyxis sp. YR583]|uniref:cupin-like domain-containing protein n=1 Tax=Sphingopyxis sp. YR583 TaxID=1881047 RepID=UPI0008A7E942|nr:cupin-like domain-containing protein [Sphingopyxis sp. YR583]SEH17752.1 Cupin-like domain-containing protein [Sphingopyxis sp. YR583]
MSQPDKRTLLAEGLAAGEEDVALHARLVAGGVSPAAAKYEIDRLAKDPMAAMLRRQAARMAKQRWLLANQDRLAREAEGGFALDTLDAPDPDTFYRHHYEANRPAKLTGLIGHWSALTRWSLDHFAAVAGGAVVEAQVERDRSPDYELAKDDHRRLVRFAELIDWLRKDEASNDIYLTAYNSGTNAAALAPLWDDMAPIALLEPRDRDGFFWLGPKGTLTPWHHDLTNNLLVQVMGRKRVRMAPPWAFDRMKNSRHCFSGWGNEALPAGEGDAATPPVLEAIIGPGEAIFLPVGWWHQVEALDLSASMSFTSFRRSNTHVDDYRSWGEIA